MGRYFNPPDETAIEAAGGRRLRLGDFDRLAGQLAPGERLGMHLDRYMFCQVPDATDPREHEEFDRQVREDIVGLLGYYAMPPEAFGLEAAPAPAGVSA